jgi:hypothetical protein
MPAQGVTPRDLKSMRQVQLRMLATARAPPKEGDTDQELAEPRELQLVLDPEYL